MMSLPSPPLSQSATAKRVRDVEARQSEPKSWGEALQRYNSQRTLPAHPSLLSPVAQPKHGIYNQTHKPAVFNPLNQTFTDANREVHTREEEKARSEKAISDAKWKRDHLANHKGYNILSGELEATTNAEVAQALHRADTSHRTQVRVENGKRLISFQEIPSHPKKRDWNILTNTMAFEGSAERLAKQDYKPPPLHNRSVKEAREFNIITTRYQYENHDARAAKERQTNEDQLRMKYFAQTHYNPISLQFVHPVEEARYQQHRISAAASHGQDQLSRLPPSMKRGEGMCYDITAPNRVKDAVQLEQLYEVPAEKHRESHQSKYVVERAVHQSDLVLDHTSAMKSHNRVSTKRYEEQLNRGFDVITNESYEGRGAKQLFKPVSEVKSGGWDKLEKERQILAGEQQQPPPAFAKQTQER